MSGFLPRGGGYRGLRVFRMAEVICDLTAFFVDRYIERGSRTKDQMVQAARSGKQNIAEGSEASVTSKETEIKLTNVAKASFEELLLDYEDYLRQHSLPVWGRDYHRVTKLRELLRSELFLSGIMKYAARMNAEEYYNLCITLINQATYMLKRLMEKQQEQFLQHGGIRERMHNARLDYRKNGNGDSRRGKG